MAQAATLFASLIGERAEVCAFAYLGLRWDILGLRHSGTGGHGMVDLPIRLVVADALAFDAAGVVMAHNHPFGDARPSNADRWMTARLARVLAAIDAPLFDHLVIADGAVVSFRALGLL